MKKSERPRQSGTQSGDIPRTSPTEPDGDPVHDGSVLGRCVAHVLRHARLISAVALLSALLAATFAATSLRLDSDTDSLFDAELDFQRNARALESAFPALRRQLVVLIEGDSPAVAHRAASRLAGRLARDREHFRSVYAPGAGSFFERNGLLYLGVEELDELVDRLAWAQPFLAELSRDPSLPTLLALLQQIVERAEDGGIPTRELADTLDLVTESLADGGAPFAWERWAIGGLDGTRELRLVYAEPRLDFSAARPTADALAQIRAEAGQLGLDADHGVRLRVTGDLALAAEELESLRRQGVLLAALSFAGISALLMFGLGSVRYALAALVTLGVGLAWTAAFAAATVGRLNLLSVSFAVLFLGLGVDFAIHFATRLIATGRGEKNRASALRASARATAPPLALCAATTAIAFFAFLPTGYRGIAELGWIAGSGMFFSLAATLFVFPAFALTLGRDPTRPVAAMRVTAGRVGRRFPGMVIAGAVLLTALALPSVRALRFDPDPIKLRDPNSESVQAFRQLVRAGPASLWTVEFIAPSLEEATRRSDRLEALPEVREVVTLARFVPANQEAKLARLEDLSFLLGDVAPRAPRPVAPDEAQRALRDLGDAIDTWLREGGGGPVARALPRLLEATGTLLREFEVSPDDYADVERLQRRMLGDLPDWLSRLTRALEAGPVRLDDLPEGLRARYLSETGAARVQVFAAGDLRTPGAMNTFVDAVRVEVPEASGSAVRIVEAGRTVTRALRDASIYAALAVSLLLLVVWRRPLRVLLLLFLVALASLFTAASSRWLGIPINFADVIVLPLLVGIGVDSAIHLLHDEGAAASAVDRGVMLSGLTTLASFGCLAFSSHPGLASLGRLLGLGVAWSLAVNLVLLPALRVWGTRFRERSASSSR